MGLVVTAAIVFIIPTLGYCQAELISQAVLTKNTPTSRTFVCTCSDAASCTADKWENLLDECRQKMEQKITSEETQGRSPTTEYKGCYRPPFPQDERLERRNMTTDMCGIHCTQKKYSLFGLKDGGKCFCGNGGIMCAYRVSEIECNVPCTGDNTKMCGGTKDMAIYQISSEKTQEPNTSEKETTISDQPPPATEYKGCYSDAWPPDLPDECLERKNMTTDMCRIHCTQKRYSLFGLKDGGKCFCDNSKIMSGYMKTSELECNIPCTGNYTQTCGGTERMAIYQVV